MLDSNPQPWVNQMKINLRDVVEFVGVGAIVASLVFVGLQMRQTQEIALTQNLIATHEIYNDAVSEMNSNAALWVKANDGASLTDEEQLILENLVMALSDSSFFTWLQSQLLYGRDAGLNTAYATAAFLHRYPAARAKWIDQATWHSENVKAYLPPNGMGETWENLVRDHLDRLDKEK